MVFFTQYYPAACFLIRRAELVPRIGVACYDEDGLIRRFLPKQLTTIDPQFSKMAHAAIDLAQKIKNGQPVAPVVVEAQLMAVETVDFGNIIR